MIADDRTWLWIAVVTFMAGMAIGLVLNIVTGSAIWMPR